VEWAIGVPMAGDYDVTVRYSAAVSRPADFIGNGYNADLFAFSGTGGYSNMETETKSTYLSEGVSTLRVSSGDLAGDPTLIGCVHSASSSRQDIAPLTFAPKGRYEDVDPSDSASRRYW
jgi:hypothetical protein